MAATADGSAAVGLEMRLVSSAVTAVAMAPLEMTATELLRPRHLMDSLSDRESWIDFAD